MFDVEWVDGNDLSPAPWRSVYVLRPDLEVLQRSMVDYGWLQPIVVRRANNTIIDGHHRWEIAGFTKFVKEKHDGRVPVHYVDCGDVEARLMHLRLNRGRGNVTAKKMSQILRDVKMSGLYEEKRIRRMLVMTPDEYDVMIDGTLVKSRKVGDHKYSSAWVPVEAPATATETASVIERPPNADR